MSSTKPADTLDLAKIDVDTFCDLNGVNDNNRNLMKKIHTNKIDSYDNWHAKLSKDFKLHPKKNFKPLK